MKRTIDDGVDGQLAIDQELHLHNWCYELSSNAMLMKTWKGLEPHLKFYFTLHQFAHDRRGPLRQSHELYVELATGDDLEAMLDHIDLHMQQGLKRTLSAMTQDNDE